METPKFEGSNAIGCAIFASPAVAMVSLIWLCEEVAAAV